MRRALLVAALAALAACALPQRAAAGVIGDRPVVAPDRLIYDDEIEFDDGFSIHEEGAELVFRRTTGELPLRTTRQACTAEGDDVVRCGALEAVGVLALELTAGDDVVDGSAVRSFRIEAHTGTGNANLTGGALDDVLTSDAGADVLDGGPGADRLSSGPDPDVILARDGASDVVDCGAGEGDRAVVDEADRVTGCELVEYPAPAPAFSGPFSSSSVAVGAGPDLSTVVRFPRARCLPRRIRVAPVNGFVPAGTVLWARGRAIARGTGERHTLRLPRLRGRRVTLRAEVTGTDGSRVTTTRAYRGC